LLSPQHLFTITHLNLPNGQVEEGHAVPDLDDGLGSDTAHCGTETTVELEHGQLVKNGRVNIVEDLVGLDLLWLRSSDLVPLALGTVSIYVYETDFPD
jgi:hypothetical protein